MVNILRVRTVTTGVPGSPWYTNLYFAGNTAADAANSVGAVVPAYDTISDVVHSSVSMTIESAVLSITAETGEINNSFETGVGATIQGGASGDLLPLATCALIRWRTSTYRNGRLVQGRSFIGGMVEPNSTGAGDPSGALQSELATAFGTLVPGAPDLVIWSRPRAATEQKPARVGAIATVTACNAWDEWAVLRSHRD